MSLLLSQLGGGASTQTLSPSLYTNVQNFLSPQLNLNLNPSLLTNGQTFFSALLILNISPGLYTDADQFFNPSLVLNVSPGLFTNTQQFFSPTVALEQDLTVGFHVDPDVFFGPLLSLDVFAPFFTDGDTFFSAEVTQSGGFQDLLPDLFMNANVFFAPALTGGDMSIARVVEQGVIPNSWFATWSSLLNGETGDSVDLPLDAATRTIQVTGTFGVGGNVVMEGSNDGVGWATLNSALGTALGTITTNALHSVDQNCRFIRPRVSAGDGTTNLKVVVVAV